MKPSQEALEAAREIYNLASDTTFGFCKDAEIVDFAQRIDAAADARYARLKRAASLICAIPYHDIDPLLHRDLAAALAELEGRNG